MIEDDGALVVAIYMTVDTLGPGDSALDGSRKNLRFKHLHRLESR
jgi:hypothetical protein